MPDDFRIGSWLVEPSLNSVTCDGKVRRLEPKMMEVLVYLAQNQRVVVSKEQLMRVVWPDTFVTDHALTRCISELRRALEDDPKEPSFIETIPKRGYRFIATVDFTSEGTRSADLRGRGRGSRRKLAALAVAVAIFVTVLVAGGVLLLRARKDSPSPSSIVVLPLEQLSGAAEQEYFVDGVTDAIITNLAKIKSLRVISRTSAMQSRESISP